MARRLETTGTIRLGPGFLDDLPMPAEHLVIADKYTVLQTIARGGMGVVYKAWQENLNRVVAVKMMLGGVHAGEEFKQRFLQEAKAAARLNHPNIVSVHDWGDEAGQPFFSMDFVDGHTLAEMAREQSLRPRAAAEMVRALAHAMHYAHSQGVLHRDLKPSNVLVDAAGVPRITDFGLARDLKQATKLTVSGDMLGTPGYLPPEQVSSKRERIGPPSDVYGLGGILYYLLTSRPPHVAGSAAEALRAVEENEPVSPKRLNPSVPMDLETICLKCLEKKPERRYGSAEALADDLGRWLNGEAISARPVSQWTRSLKWVRRKPALAGAIACGVVAFVFGTAGVVWQWQKAETARQRMETAYEAATQATDAEREARDLANTKRQQAENALVEVQKAQAAEATALKLAHEKHIEVQEARHELEIAHEAARRAADLADAARTESINVATALTNARQQLGVMTNKLGAMSEQLDLGKALLKEAEDKLSELLPGDRASGPDASVETRGNSLSGKADGKPGVVGSDRVRQEQRQALPVILPPESRQQSNTVHELRENVSQASNEVERVRIDTTRLRREIHNLEAVATNAEALKAQWTVAAEVAQKKFEEAQRAAERQEAEALPILKRANVTLAALDEAKRRVQSEKPAEAGKEIGEDFKELRGIKDAIASISLLQTVLVESARSAPLIVFTNRPVMVAVQPNSLIRTSRFELAQLETPIRPNPGRNQGQGQGRQEQQNQVGQGQGNPRSVGQGQGRQGLSSQNQVGQGQSQGRQGQGGSTQLSQGRQGVQSQGQGGKGQDERNIGRAPGIRFGPGSRDSTFSDTVAKGRTEGAMLPSAKPPPPALKEVKKSNGETERLAPSGVVRERTKVDEKSGVKQTERIAATGRVERKEVEDRNGTKQVTHYDLGREKRAEVTRKDGSKDVTDVHYNRDGKERARETVRTDVSGKVVSKTVVKNVTINKTVIKTENHYVVGRYGFVYRPVVVVRPVLFVNPYWYTPAGVVIVHPFHYSWGFHADPWYGYHAYYWEPYPVYQTPSYWVTDWMLAGYLADSYAISTSVAQTREEVRLAREDAEKARLAAERAADAAEKAEAQAEQAAAEARAAKAEARAAKAELEESKRKELAGKPNPKATPIDKETKDALQNQVAKTIEQKRKSGDDQTPPDVAAALADPEHIYPVSKKMAGLSADDGEPAGFLTPGDLLKLKRGQEIPKEPSENMFVTLVVMTSKGDDDSVPAGTKIRVQIKDLQEFDNEFRAKLDAGLTEAGKNQDAFKSGSI